MSIMIIFKVECHLEHHHTDSTVPNHKSAQLLHSNPAQLLLHHLCYIAVVHSVF